MFNVNLKSQFFLIKELLPLLLKGGKGRNILTLTSYGAVDPFANIGVYNLTKAGQVAMVKFLAEELLDSAIRINALAPGLVPTDMSRGAFGEEAMKGFVENFGHFVGSEEDIASYAAVVCAEEGKFMNGEMVAVRMGTGKL
mmetsp:Transcript_26997/g.20201  ORF Transcript_26997/g.20201 Transcript_26997/m.20201 type:complete len:141 (+) Transcript_26997:310-732(+)